MSLIEIVPQKPKEYDARKQDHGDAAAQKARLFKETYDGEVQHNNFVKNENKVLHDILADTEIEYAAMNSAQLEAEADKLLGEKALVFSTATLPEKSLIVKNEQEDDVIDYDNDGFLTEADFGIKSKHEIIREMARRVTLDADYDNDDTGDSDYASPVRIKNRL